MNLGQIVQSHALSFFHLSAPDLVLGMDSDPAQRNIFGLIAAEPELARGGIRLRQFGQEIIEALGGKKDPPSLVCARRRARAPDRGAPRADPRPRPRGKGDRAGRLVRFKDLLVRFREESETFGNFPTLFMGLIGPDGSWEHYDGRIRVTDSQGHIVADGFEAARYRDFIGEAVQPDSYLKSPYYLPLGYPEGIYRVGPLARLNVCTQIGTPLADQELEEYRQRGGRTVNSSFWYHYARLIEILAAVESIERLLDDPDLLSRPAPGPRRDQHARGRRRERGAPRHALPPLPRGR